MLGRLLRACTRPLASLGALAGILAFSCSFYTDNPCANQPHVTPAAAGGPAAGAGGRAGSGGAPSVGGNATGAEGGAAGIGEGGNGGANPMPPPAVWVPAIGNLANRSSASGGVIFVAAKPDENLLILSVVMNGLWGSRDGGTSWQTLGTGSASALIQNMATHFVYDPDDTRRFWESGIYGPGVYRTDDDGKNFASLGDIVHNEYLSIDFSDPKRQLMLTGGHEQSGTLNRSTDGGMTWEQIGDALPSSCSQSTWPVIIDANTYVLGCRNSILRSTDAGVTWDVVNSYGGAGAPLFTSTGDIFWGIDMNGGLVKSSDEGQTWERVVGGGVISGFPPVELPDGSLAALATDVIVRSEDGGESWTPITPQAPYQPNGFMYSLQERAFFIWNSASSSTIPKDAVERFDFEP
jgi:photosystem II stability/assembly factor-like uncharacterized protein